MKIQYQDPQLIIFESALFRTSTTLIIGDDYILLVDPNWLPIEIDFIGKWTQQLGNTKEKYLLFTHSDYDHIIGYGRFKSYQTIASKAFVGNKNQDAILKQINDFDDEYYIKRDYEIVYPRIDLPISGDGSTWSIKSDDYLFYQAPGHNPDGLITYNKSRKILIVGDYLSNIEFPYLYDSFVRYQATLDKLEHLINTEEVAFLITGHGDHTSSKSEMQKRIIDSRIYIDAVIESIKAKTPFDFDQLMKAYDFPGIMRKFHDGNMVLAKKEFWGV